MTPHGERRLAAHPGSRPVFPRYVRMQFDPVRGRYAVLAPERVYWPDGVAVDTLRQCDGVATVEDIAERLAAEYAAPKDTIRSDIMDFIQSWMDLRLLRSNSP